MGRFSNRVQLIYIFTLVPVIIRLLADVREMDPCYCSEACDAQDELPEIKQARTQARREAMNKALRNVMICTIYIILGGAIIYDALQNDADIIPSQWPAKIKAKLLQLGILKQKQNNQEPEHNAVDIASTMEIRVL